MVKLTRRSAIASFSAFAAALQTQGSVEGTDLKSQETQMPYLPSWTSLRRHHNPQWLSDAKFGIYTHWGPQRGSDLATWRPDKFDPEKWAELIKNTGARFAGPVSEHGAQVAMWDSNLTGLTV